jgi:hypothetical protein
MSRSLSSLQSILNSAYRMILKKIVRLCLISRALVCDSLRICMSLAPIAGLLPVPDVGVHVQYCAEISAGEGEK